MVKIVISQNSISPMAVSEHFLRLLMQHLFINHFPSSERALKDGGHIGKHQFVPLSLHTTNQDADWELVVIVIVIVVVVVIVVIVVVVEI
jgi:hypothetical protein